MRLLILALGTFAIGTEGFVIAGVLPLIATDLRVSVAAAGQLVTLFALAYAMAATVMATLTAAMPRPPRLVTAMAVFTAPTPSPPSRPAPGGSRSHACWLPFPPPPTRPPRARWLP